MPSPATKSEAADFSEFLGMVLRDGEVDPKGRSLEDLLALFREQWDTIVAIQEGMKDREEGRGVHRETAMAEIRKELGYGERVK